MLKIHAHDIINDIAIYETAFGFTTRYGLDIRPRRDTYAEALEDFQACQRHAMGCAGHSDDIDAAA